MRMFSYWEGFRPAAIQTCLDSMRRVCGKSWTLVTPETLSDHIPDGTLSPQFAVLKKPEQRADCVRAALLATHGGLWLDADTVMLRHPLGELSYVLDRELVYSSWDKPPFRVLNGYIYACSGSSLAQQWLQKINATLESTTEKQAWTALGEHILTPLVKESATACRVRRATFLPIDVDADVQAFFRRRVDWQSFLHPESVAFGLNWSWMWHHRKADMDTTPEFWKTSTFVIHQLLSRAHELNQVGKQSQEPEAC